MAAFALEYDSHVKLCLTTLEYDGHVEIYLTALESKSDLKTILKLILFQGVAG